MRTSDSVVSILICLAIITFNNCASAEKAETGGHEFHVSITGSDENDGSRSMPFRNILVGGSLDIYDDDAMPSRMAGNVFLDNAIPSAVF